MDEIKNNCSTEDLESYASFLARIGEIDIAVDAYKQAAAHGSLFSYFWMGWLCRLEQYNYYDLRESFRWMRDGALKGSVPCAYILAYYYHGGIGCEQDEEASLYWMNRADEVDPDGSQFEAMKAMFSEDSEVPAVQSENQYVS